MHSRSGWVGGSFYEHGDRLGSGNREYRQNKRFVQSDY